MISVEVSVIMLVYNQEKYLEHALESVVTQKTNFDFEVIVGEDCSTDQSRKILLEYQKKYPQLVKPLLHEKNVGMNNNAHSVIHECKGKYLAFCEGDDFWTDSLKLQKQYDFMESQPEYMGVTHDFNVVDKDEKPLDIELGYYSKAAIYSFRDAVNHLFPSHTATLFVKNIFKDNEPLFQLFAATKGNGDEKLAFCLTLFGNIYKLSDSMSCYRFIREIGGSSWSSRVLRENLTLYFMEQERGVAVMVKKIKGIELKDFQLFNDILTGSLMIWLKSRKSTDFKIFVQAFSQTKQKFSIFVYLLVSVVKRSINKVKKVIRKVISRKKKDKVNDK